MEGLVVSVVVLFSVIAVGYSNSQVDLLHSMIENLKTELEENNNRFRQEMNDARVALQIELERKIDAKTRNVDTELRQVKEGQEMMKTQLNSVMNSLRDVIRERDTYREAYIKAQRSKAESPLNCGGNAKLLKKVLKQCKQLVVRTYTGKGVICKDNSNLTLALERLNSTCREEIGHSGLSPILSMNTTASAPLSTTASSPTAAMKRLIIGCWGDSELSQLNPLSNSLSKYSLQVSGGVYSLCFVQRLGRLLVGTHKPDRVTSTTLDGFNTKILINIRVIDMDVDEGRELVFMTSQRPIRITSMTTSGNNFIVIRSLTREYAPSLSIAVDSIKKVIYSSSGKNVFRLNYDGKVLRVLASGDMWGVSFDSVSNILYFNEENTLKKMSMSDEVVSDVTTLRIRPSTLAFYNNTVYYGGWFTSPYVGAVQLGETIVDTELVRTQYTGNLIICLVP